MLIWNLSDGVDEADVKSNIFCYPGWIREFVRDGWIDGCVDRWLISLELIGRRPNGQVDWLFDMGKLPN